ncbi:uncharacterized protein MELLADRAFT_111208 [Melampsora larici-populina 98AG31]|uniref:Uncharacterized protein n=1 Tax=Melampsora larici-populina (strain 98AG31 / pathotype 3-4-7) TaxID=747676 RepID=F4S2D9_MELLP|nr:uncharacterized protein MELLADRAFT_111208 [Melampsora larici-populina 98AG31]EGG01158.1 hypothetical protein MELLADRAFT_111208 [Melampsora larici-populina 98AG31]
MSAFNHHRVHFLTSPNQSTPTPSSSSRYTKLSKLSKAITTNANHFNLNHDLINSSIHLNHFHHQITQTHQTHDLNSKSGSLIKLSNKLFCFQTSNNHQEQLSLTEFELSICVIKSQLDPIEDFIQISELSSSKCRKLRVNYQKMKVEIKETRMREIIRNISRKTSLSRVIIDEALAKELGVLYHHQEKHSTHSSIDSLQSTAAHHHHQPQSQQQHNPESNHTPIINNHHSSRDRSSLYNSDGLPTRSASFSTTTPVRTPQLQRPNPTSSSLKLSTSK